MTTSYYIMQMSKNKGINFQNYYNGLYKTYSLMIQDTYSKCRICLNDGSIPIYDSENAEELCKAVQSIAEIEINEEDRFSKLLCKTCYKFIRSAIIFRKIAKQSDELLRRPVKEEHSFNQSLEDYGDHDFVENTEPIQEWTEQEKYDIKIEKKEKLKITQKVTCHVCNKVINRSYYKEHMTVHDPNHYKYVCDVCGKSFRLRCAYYNHSLRHRDGFPFKCQFCPYKGRYAELLKTHMKTHTGDYRYMCTECPARFLFKSNLNSHMLKHKEPQFHCETCKRAFHTKLMLQRHYEADHLGIKNHVCNMCGKAFGYRNAMMKHQRHVHKREKLLFGRKPSYLEAENNRYGHSPRCD